MFPKHERVNRLDLHTDYFKSNLLVYFRLMLGMYFICFVQRMQLHVRYVEHDLTIRLVNRKTPFIKANLVSASALPYPAQ